MKRLFSLLVLLALAATRSQAVTVGEWRLWYERPAPLDACGWERESLPVGNGWFGVSVFGGVARERLQFTEPTFLTRRPHRNGGFPANLPDTLDAWIETAHATPTNYVRWLDLETARAGVAYTTDGVRFTRECFASYPDRVFALRLTADRIGALAFTLRGEIPFIEPFAADGGSGPFGRRGTVTASGRQIDLREEAEAFGCRLFAQFRVETDGAVAASSNALTVTQATAATVLFSVGTNYRLCSETFRTQRAYGSLDEAAVVARLDAASRKGYTALKAAHVADYRALACRSEIRLAHDAADARLPTDVLRAQKARTSAYLHQLYWRYGKYLLVSASRPGTLPASLQGVWAGPLKETPWGSGYWYNINVQMNYWPAFSCNLADCFQALADFNAAWQSTTRAAAVDYLRRHVPANVPSPNEEPGLWSVGTAVYPYTVEGAPGGHSGPGTLGLTTKLYGDWWAFTRDRVALGKYIWPTLRGAAAFLQRCVVETNGLWLAAFSASPEQRIQPDQAQGGEPGTYFHGLGCAFDQQMLYENACDLIAVAHALGREDDSVVRTAQAQRTKYDPVILGASGQIKEFREETHYSDIGERHHRHISQLCGLMPGTQITAATPTWLAAARRTLDLRGDRSTGWALAHRLCARARCGDGERAFALLGNLLADRTNANLWDMHPPFQIDGNLGATAGIAEMLLQSHETTADGKVVIRLLPALPTAWAKAGSVRGLCARGGYTVSFAWQDGRVVSSSVVGLPDSPGFVLKENGNTPYNSKESCP
mgnify:CR=1 FL=1